MPKTCYQSVNVTKLPRGALLTVVMPEATYTLRVVALFSAMLVIRGGPFERWEAADIDGQSGDGWIAVGGPLRLWLPVRHKGRCDYFISKGDVQRVAVEWRP